MEAMKREDGRKLSIDAQEERRKTIVRIMPIRTVGEYLKRWGFAPQKPVKFAYERRPEKVIEWLNQRFPEIRKRALKEKAEIYWGDETGLRSADVRG